MKIFKSNMALHLEQLDEEALYATVAQEITNQTISSGLYTKALAECNGDENLAKAKYIKMRVSMIKSERAAINEQIRQAQIETDKNRELERLRQEQVAQQLQYQTQYQKDIARRPGDISFLLLGALIGGIVGYIINMQGERFTSTVASACIGSIISIAFRETTRKR